MIRPLVLVAISLAACGKRNQTPVESLPGSTPGAVTERTEGGLVVQEVDLNGDGRPEIFNHYRKTLDGTRFLVKKALDLDMDGSVDVVSWFDDAGRLTKEEMDGDFDGRFDWIDHYQQGVRVMSEVDTDYDGKPNVWSYYADGRIERKERDLDGDGHVDYWERFDAEGNVVTTGADTDGDGMLDVRDQ